MTAYSMTGTRTEPADVAVLVAAAPMPEGYRLEVHPQRQYRYRSLWAIRVYRAGDVVWDKALYNVAAGLVMAQRWAWADAGEAKRVVTLTPVEECDICKRREADVSVVIEGRIVGVCSTCYERAEDEGDDDA